MEDKITRRQALKAALVAASGLTITAFVPKKWTKPLVTSGMLPVHARTSGTKMYVFGRYNSTGSNGGPTFHVVGIRAFVGLSPVNPLVNSGEGGSVKLASPTKKDILAGGFTNGVPNVPVSLYYHNDPNLSPDWHTSPDLSRNPLNPLQTVFTDKDGVAVFDTMYFNFLDTDHCQFDFFLDFSSPECTNSPASKRCRENGCG